MDATVGFININQNKIVKIFSVASVALLPPTLIASIYGMNFKTVPGAGLDLRLPVLAGADGDFRGYSVLDIPSKRLAQVIRVAFCQHSASTRIQEPISSYCPIW